MTTLPSIVQSRVVRLPSYNDYREDLKMPRLTGFDQLTSSVRLRAELERLYGSVDKLEFYVGIFAEDPRPNSVLPSLLGTMVGLHAFSQLMTNPLLATGIWDHPTHSLPRGGGTSRRPTASRSSSGATCRPARTCPRCA